MWAGVRQNTSPKRDKGIRVERCIFAIGRGKLWRRWWGDGVVKLGMGGQEGMGRDEPRNEEANLEIGRVEASRSVRSVVRR